jgi:hypothetical protein
MKQQAAAAAAAAAVMAVLVVVLPPPLLLLHHHGVQESKCVACGGRGVCVHKQISLSMSHLFEIKPQIWSPWSD